MMSGVGEVEGADGANVVDGVGAVDREQRGDPWIGLALALGLGLALAPLWALWAGRLLPAGPWSGPPALALMLVLPPLVWAGHRLRGRRRQAAGTDPADDVARAALGLLLLLATLARLAEIRGLAVPQFGDSVHHSMIVRLFQLKQGLPDDWEPFAPLASFSYHFGFHAQAAGLAALGGWDAPRAILVLGQLLMVAQALSLYALAAGLSGRPWAGLGAALAAAGLSPMPATYLNWGRYTQLAGQVLLPLALLAALRVLAAPRAAAGAAAAGSGGRRLDRWGPTLLAAVLAAGLFLTHYLVVGFFILGILAWVLLEGGVTLVRGPGGSDGSWRWYGTETTDETDGTRTDPSYPSAHIARRWRGRLGALLGMGGPALLLIAPWLPQLAGGAILPSAAALGTGKVADPDVYGVLPDVWAMWRPDALGRNVGWPLILGAGLGLLAALGPGSGAARPDRPRWMSPRRLALVGLLWLALLLLAAYPRLLGLPITGVLKDFTLAIAAYLPLGLVLGGGLAALVGKLRVGPGNPRAAGLLSLAAALLVAGLAWHGRSRRDDSFRLVFPDDLSALAWIREQTPEDAGFLVSSFAAFGQTVQAGDDAGWWLSQLAAPRRSTLPPITVGLEASQDPGYREAVNRLAALWREDLDGPETLSALRAAGVGYAFVGVSGKALDRAGLAASPCWTPLFNADADPADGRPGAAVFALGPPGCEAAGARP